VNYLSQSKTEEGILNELLVSLNLLFFKFFFSIKALNFVVKTFNKELGLSFVYNKKENQIIAYIISLITWDL
jgi:hypothetical protein